MELYLGAVDRAPKVEMATDAVVRTATAKEVTGGHRLYGIVDGDLLYAQDMAAVGQPLHAAPGRETHPRRRLAGVRQPKASRDSDGRRLKPTKRSAVSPTVERLATRATPSAQDRWL